MVQRSVRMEKEFPVYIKALMKAGQKVPGGMHESINSDIELLKTRLETVDDLSTLVDETIEHEGRRTHLIRGNVIFVGFVITETIPELQTKRDVGDIVVTIAGFVPHKVN